MPLIQLPNYLIANRKRLALSQAEVAFLLGIQTGETVCRHERFVREPGLETALAYEVIFQKPVRELFGGLYQKVEKEVEARAKILAEKMEQREPNSQTAHKREALTKIAARQSVEPVNQP